MSPSIGILVYIMIWVMVLFIVLPWGVRIPEKIELGHADSAPQNPYIGIKFLITTAVSALLWVVAFLILKV